MEVRPFPSAGGRKRRRFEDRVRVVTEAQKAPDAVRHKTNF